MCALRTRLLRNAVHTTRSPWHGGCTRDVVSLELTMRPVLLSIVLAACTASASSSLPAGQLATPLVLDDSPFVRGETQDVLVSGANAGDTVALIGTRSEEDGTVCISAPAVCFDLPGPRSQLLYLGDAVADGDGEARISISVPANADGPFHLQAVADAYGTPYLSDALEAAFVDNDDMDGDGYAAEDDCDDDDPDVHPDQPELCDGIDNNCDEIVDGTDAWFDDAFAYRLPLTITGAATYATESPPVSVDVDFAAALAALGDDSGFDADSIRVVRQDCDAGMPEMPAELVDSLQAIFDKADMTATTGDDAGALVFLADSDGDYASADIVNAATDVAYAVYFNSMDTTDGSASSHASELSTSLDGTTMTLSNGLVEATFDGTRGGMADHIATVGGITVADQASTNLGQGVYMSESGGGDGAWLSASADEDATLSVVHDGDIVSVVRAEGAFANDWGGFAYSYTYVLFEGRPEIYAKATIELDQDSVIRQGTFWGAGVRLWFANNSDIAGSDGEGAGGVPDYNWVRGAYDTDADPYGIGIGYRQSVALRSHPIYDETGSSNAGRYLGLAGQDLTDTFVSGDNEYAGVAGDRLIDHSMVAIYPHEGAFSTVSSDFYGILEGVEVAVGDAEAR
jgi:hypothetical protein